MPCFLRLIQCAGAALICARATYLQNRWTLATHSRPPQTPSASSASDWSLHLHGPKETQRHRDDDDEMRSLLVRMARAQSFFAPLQSAVR